jgi:hypothetical protein
MTRTPCEHPAEPRSVVFLCQECHGDLEPLRRGFGENSVWECQACRCRWVYGRAGWERVQ